jgi:putative Holliday junction resolvase
MKLLGLDIGERRIGVAFGDSTLRLATPVDVIVRTSLEQDARAVGAFVCEYGATQLVVGLPRNMDGTTGAQAEATQAYAEKITRALDLPLVFWDERLTTVEATRRTRATGAPTRTSRGLRRGRKSRRALDAIAAAVILQDFMDAHAGGFDEDVT